MMPDDQFSFRWGIPWLDRDFMQIPTSFFRTYTKVGVTRSEFLLVLHLASYKYESREGESRPSLRRIAEEMGTTTRSVQRMRRSLEEKGLLGVYYQRGHPSVYSFEGLGGALMGEEERGDTSVRGDTHVGGGVTPVSGVGVTPTSPEEQEDKKKKQEQEQPEIAALSQDQETAMVALRFVGVNAHVAEDLAKKHTLRRVVEVVEAVGDGRDIRNVGAWVVRALERGYKMPLTKGGSERMKRLEASVAACAYHRNPGLGLCPGVDPDRVPWMMCGACVRGEGETAPVAKQQELLF